MGGAGGGAPLPPGPGSAVSAPVPDLAPPLRWDAPPPAAGPVRSIYVHAPFCARRCSYCDFAVTVRKRGDVQAWAGALAGEWRALREEGVAEVAPALETLYVGGGTPSLLGAEAMEALARVLGRERLAADGIEWTAEANPESLTPAVARGWREAGVNRLSLGVQSFDPAVLRWMGRLHGPDGAGIAVEAARRAGIEELSVDLIFGLPPGVERDWERDLEEALRLDVPHVSLYGLTVEPGTPLGRAVAEGRERGVDEGRYADEFLRAAERLGAEGYVHYEVSNFARPGHTSRHNRAYWEEAPYLGLGNSAHTFLPPRRRWNLRSWDAYEERARVGLLPVEGEEVVEGESWRLERLWLALRSRRGLDPGPLRGAAEETVRGWLAAGWAERDRRVLRLTPHGWLLLDRLAVELDTALVDAGTEAAPALS